MELLNAGSFIPREQQDKSPQVQRTASWAQRPDNPKEQQTPSREILDVLSLPPSTKESHLPPVSLHDQVPFIAVLMPQDRMNSRNPLVKMDCPDSFVLRA